MIITVNGKWIIDLPKHRAEKPEWFTKEGWEKKRIESMVANLNSDDHLFYIGAEEGDIPAIIQKYTKCYMSLFEPGDKVWSNIKAIWRANGLLTPNTFSGFASNLTTEGAFYTFQIGFPINSEGEIITDHGFMELQNHNAPEIKIDDCPYTPTALSIDVEGSEWQVLRGAEKTLREIKPKIWLSLHPEFMFRMYGEYQQDLRNWLKDFGYKETFLDYQHEIHLFYEPL